MLSDRWLVWATVAVAVGSALLPSESTLAADRDGACCGDLEARIEELEAAAARHGRRVRADGVEHELKIKGVINQALLYWHDGKKRNGYIVDSQQSGGELEIEAETKFANGWKIGATMGFDVRTNPSDLVSQRDPRGLSGSGGGLQRENLGPGIESADLSLKFEHRKYGSFQLGFQDTASDDIDNMNLAQSNVLANAGVDSWNSSFFVRGKAGAAPSQLLDNVRWGDFFEGNQLGGTIPSVRYTSPIIAGFQGAAAFGADDIWDVALRYGGEFSGFRLIGGIGYFSNRSEEPGDIDPREDRGWGGSIAAIHVPTGLNLAINYSELTHTKNCTERGDVSGLCRGPDRMFYVKGGLVRDLNALGPTAFHIEYFRQIKDSRESEGDVLADLESVPGSAMELKRSTGTMWGLGVVQKINDTEKKGKKKNGDEEDEDKKEFFGKKDDTPMELYLGFRRYSLDTDLVSDTGPVASKKLSDFSVVLSGVKIRF